MQPGSTQLAAWLARNTLGQREAARRLKIHYTMLNKYLKGHRLPGRETAIAIQEKTGIPVAAWASRVGKRAGRRSSISKYANVGAVSTHV